TVFAAVFHKHDVGLAARAQRPRDVKPGHRALEGLGEDRFLRLTVDLDAHALEQRRVGLIPGHGKHKVIRHHHRFALSVLDDHVVRPYLHDLGLAVGHDGALVNAVFNIGLHPIFRVQTIAAHHGRNAASRAPQFQRHLRRRTPGAYYADIVTRVEMRLRVAVRNLRERLTRDVHGPGTVVK